MKNESLEKKLYIIEQFFIKGKSIRSIAKQLKMSNGKISKYLKSQGFTIDARVGNSDYNRQKLFEELEQIWLKEGGSIKLLCKQHKTTASSFITYLRFKNHIIIPHRNAENKELKEDKLKKAEKLYLDGYSISAAAKEVHINNTTLSDYLYYKNYNTSKNWRIELKNENLFEIIDSEEKAYWLGFFYADASIQYDEYRHSLEVSLKYEDINHLEKLKKFLQTAVEIKTKKIKGKGEKVYKACRISIFNKKLVGDLVDKGCLPKKSLILRFPDDTILPADLRYHFIRGYFDGDGCLYLPNKATKGKPQAILSFVGTKQFLLELRRILGLTNTVFHNKGNVYQTQHGGNYKVDIYLSKMYENATIYLDRKFLKYHEFLRNFKCR